MKVFTKVKMTLNKQFLLILIEKTEKEWHDQNRFHHMMSKQMVIWMPSMKKVQIELLSNIDKMFTMFPAYVNTMKNSNID